MAKDIEILLELLWYFQLIIVSGMLHEFGHYLLAKYYKLDPKIMIHGQYVAVAYKGTDYKKNLLILSMGIITGLIYILYNIRNAPYDIKNVVVLMAYLLACHSDVSQIYHIMLRFKKPKNIGTD